MAFILSFAALIPLDQLGHYVHWGWVDMSVANLIIIILMIVVFIAAISAPFPGRRGRKENR